MVAVCGGDCAVGAADAGFNGARTAWRCDADGCNEGDGLGNKTFDFNVAEIVVSGRGVVVVVVVVDLVVVVIAVNLFAVGLRGTFGLNIGRNDSAVMICSNPVNVI